MAAKTQKASLALRRLAKAMGYKLLKGNAAQRLSDGLLLQPKPALKQLATLAWIAARLKDVDAAAVAAWTGNIPSVGLAGWEQEALERLNPEKRRAVKSVRRRKAA